MELLRTKGLTKKYLRKRAINHLDLSLEAGKVYGLLGPNESGKTTFMKLVAGVTQPSGGLLRIMDMRVGGPTKRLVSYLPTINHLPKWMTVGQAIRFYHDFYKDFDIELATNRMEEMGLKEKQKTTSLSTGMLGRLKVLLAMSRRARLYLLDEPLNGLDHLSREKAMAMILASAREDSAIILATHIIKEIEEIMNQVIFLKEGQVALTGGIEELSRDQAMSLSDLYKEVYEDA